MAIEREGIAVDITASVGDFVSGIGQAVSSLTGFRAATAVAAGASVAFFGVSAVKSFASYEQALGNAARKHDVDLATMEAGVDALAATTDKFSRAGLANALDAIAQGSRSPAESFKILAAGVSLADAKNADLVESTEAVNSVLEAYSLEAEEAARVADVLLAASDFSGVAIRDLGAELVATRAKAEGFGLTFEQQVAMVAALASKGLDARQMFGALGELDNADSPIAASFRKEFGVIAKEGDRLRPLNEIFEEMRIRIESNGQSLKDSGLIFQNVFGDRAGPIIHSYLLSQHEIVAAHNAVANSSGATAEAIANDAGATASSVSELQAAWADLVATFGETAAPAAIPLIEGATTGLDGLAGYIDYIKEGWGDLKEVLTGEGDGIRLEPREGSPAERFNNWLAEIGAKIAAFDLWGSISGVFANVRTNIASWVNDARSWLSNLGANIVAGVTDFGPALWAKIRSGLSFVKNQWNSWMSGSGGLGSLIGNSVNGLTGNVAPAPVAPAASSAPGGVNVTVHGDIVTSANNAAALTSDIMAKAGRSAEYDAKYGALSWRRGSSWG